MKKSSLTSSGLNIEKIQSYKEENIDYFENGENDVQAQKISAIDKDISVKKYFIIQAEGFFPVFPGGCVQVGEDGEKENFLVTEVNFQAVTRTDASGITGDILYVDAGLILWVLFNLIKITRE